MSLVRSVPVEIGAVLAERFGFPLHHVQACLEGAVWEGGRAVVNLLGLWLHVSVEESGPERVVVRVLYRPSGQGQAARWEVVGDVRALAALSGAGHLPPPGRYLRLAHVKTGREECWPLEVVHGRRAGKPDPGAWVITPAHAGLSRLDAARGQMARMEEMERSA